MTLTQEQLEAHSAVKHERALGIRLSMVRECAELAVRQCIEFAPETDRLALKRVDNVLEEILALTKGTFFAIKDIEDAGKRHKFVSDIEPQPVSRKLCMRDEEDRNVDVLARTVLANLGDSTIRVVQDNIERFNVPIRTMSEDESLILAISRVELGSDGESAGMPAAHAGVQYSIDFKLLDHKNPDDSDF